MSVTIPSLDPVTDILDTDKIMVTQSNGQTYTIDGASFNKRNQAVIASSTTLTGAPLKTGNIVRAYFTADITGVNTSTGLVLNYNGSNKNVKVPKDGALANFTAQNMGGSPTVYKYLQAYTTLELLYDGTNFVIIGNPVVISSSDYTIYADGNEVYTLNKTATLLSSKANIQIYGNTSNYLNSTNKYLRINTNLANSDIGYYRTIPILLCSNSADVVAVANITRGDAGVGVTLSYITNNNTLSYVKTQIEDGKQILYFQTTKTWAHLYSVYNLVGIQPELSAVSSIPE